MKNFIFKSDADFHKILFNKLDMLLTENRHQRMDLADIKRVLHMLNTDSALQKQVDEYIDEKTDVPLEDMAQDGNSSSD